MDNNQRLHAIALELCKCPDCGGSGETCKYGYKLSDKMCCGYNPLGCKKCQEYIVNCPTCSGTGMVNFPWDTCWHELVKWNSFMWKCVDGCGETFRKVDVNPNFYAPAEDFLKLIEIVINEGGFMVWYSGKKAGKLAAHEIILNNIHNKKLILDLIIEWEGK